jgi:hypothetical protein
LKPVIRRIEIKPDKLEELKSKLKSDMMSTRRHWLIKKYAGGTCQNCLGIPTIMAIYDVSDPEMQARVIERYCDSCYENSGVKGRIRLTSTNGIDETIAVRDKIISGVEHK